MKTFKTAQKYFQSLSLTKTVTNLITSLTDRCETFIFDGRICKGFQTWVTSNSDCYFIGILNAAINVKGNTKDAISEVEDLFARCDNPIEIHINADGKATAILKNFCGVCVSRETLGKAPSHRLYSLGGYNLNNESDAEKALKRLREEMVEIQMFLNQMVVIKEKFIEEYKGICVEITSTRAKELMSNYEPLIDCEAILSYFYDSENNKVILLTRNSK